MTRLDRGREYITTEGYEGYYWNAYKGTTKGWFLLMDDPERTHYIACVLSPPSYKPNTSVRVIHYNHANKMVTDTRIPDLVLTEETRDLLLPILLMNRKDL